MKDNNDPNKDPNLNKSLTEAANALASEAQSIAGKREPKVVVQTNTTFDVTDAIDYALVLVSNTDLPVDLNPKVVSSESMKSLLAIAQQKKKDEAGKERVRACLCMSVPVSASGVVVQWRGVVACVVM